MVRLLVLLTVTALAYVLATLLPLPEWCGPAAVFAAAESVLHHSARG